MKTGSNDVPILIVDDQKTMLRIVRKLLVAVGFDNVEEARDGASALELLRSKSFKLVISDLNMAPMTGLQLLQEIRADSGLHELPFVMMTTENTAQHEIAAKRQGATVYIAKPFNVGTLREAIEATLAGRSPGQHSLADHRSNSSSL
jgi:two-component system, chemotaxis family, chemotaxis protein CheY